MDFVADQSVIKSWFEFLSNSITFSRWH
jgi:hypothetical protein